MNLVRPAIEKEIARIEDASEVRQDGESEQYRASTVETSALSRRAQANDAINTFRRAQQGDPEAQDDLNDLKKELLDEEPTDEEIFRTILRDQSGNPFAQDLTLEVMLTDEQAQAHQDVLDLFKDFRGGAASVDSVIKPKQQIDLFLKLTEGGGSLTERMFFARKALTVLTDHGNRSLFEGLHTFHLLDGADVVASGVEQLKAATTASPVVPNHA